MGVQRKVQRQQARKAGPEEQPIGVVARNLVAVLRDAKLGGGAEGMRYLIVMEKTDTGFSAYSPDVPGCASAGRTEEEIKANMEEALALHVDGLRKEGLPVPMPSTKPIYVEIPA